MSVASGWSDGTPAVRRGIRAFFSLVLLFGTGGLAGNALAGQALAPPGDPAWAPLLFPGIDRPTRFELTTDPAGRPAYRATSDCGASAMRLGLPKDLSAEKTPKIAWRWRIEQPLDVPQEKTKAGDDFAARVYILFPFQPEAAGPFERLQRRIGRSLFGVEMPGKSLNYVFASRVAPGESWTSPYHGDARLIAVARASDAPRRSGDPSEGGKASEGWTEVIVDWTADAARLFSPAPGVAPYALAVMVDADSVCERAIAWFSDFRLVGP